MTAVSDDELNRDARPEPLPQPTPDKPRIRSYSFRATYLQRRPLPELEDRRRAPGLRRAGLRWGALLALVVVLGLAGVPVYIHPQIDPLRKADAIVVLGGTAYERFDMGLDLAQRGYARSC